MMIQAEARNEVRIFYMDNGAENALNSELIGQFNAALDEIEADDAVRGVVVAGAPGNFFSSIPPSGCLAMVKYVIGERMTDLAFLSGRKFDGPAALAAGMVDELAEKQVVLDRAAAVAAELGAKNPRLFAAYKNRFRGETAECMLAEDLRYIDEEMDVTMFQNCDLSCLKSLS